MYRFSPLDLSGDRTLLGLFQHYGIPADFLTERLRSVTQANSTRILPDGSRASWFHYLCKNLDVGYPTQKPHSGYTSTGLEIIELHGDNQVRSKQFKNDNWTWLRSAFFLKSGGSEIRLENGPTSKPCTTLICFGAPKSLEKRFEDLATSPSWTQCVDAPYNLFVIVLDELFLEMDEQAWRLAGVFRGVETAAITNAKKTLEVWITPSRQDITGLHNIAKHCIYLREAFDAVIMTVEGLIEQHLGGYPETSERESTSSMLKYKLGLFRAVNLRLASLDKRISNILSLSFNLQTAQDSRLMQKDSNTMKSIAVLALVFLPASTVAAIFSSPFFSMDDAVSPQKFRVSGELWIFWSIVAPMTLAVVAMWLAYDRMAVRRWEKDLQSH
ncbi:corA-like mg2+ transporter protein domain-containing protein [Pochonia chlamydosporia 170]|uniref:CorA-like mg2+ transporter protein domain-containing protein n=1 Tax=Pochonia chlamydosporia 170 TaxID=1380566 RepID=A0A179FNN0_METCM|nr:corA-like mg2+ transporter protein domain-containing protein [Pochonia chlamydosporia 170]OAQ67202.1 corA-like mg2+ transporter protein domain-containing protein [Pochonia chlamydosporia 170]